MVRPVRLGIVGAGAVTQVGHLPALKRIKEIDVVGICDNDLPKARTLADRFGVPDAFGDIGELVDFESLDALLICTPSHLHESHIMTALAAGLHIFVERPLALTSAAAVKLVKAAEAQQRVVMVGANHRYRPDVQQIRSFVQSGELGSLESIRAWWFVARGGRVSLGWRQRRELAGGGAMLDLGLGLLDVAMWLSGFLRPQRVSAIFPTAGRDGGVEPSGTAMIALEGGVAIHLDTTWRFVGPGERYGLAVRASGGSARINPLAIWKEFHGAPQDVASAGAHSRETPFALGLRAQWAHFVACVHGESPRPQLQEQVMLLKVMEAIYQSAEQGRDVTL
ncbi:MAG TPA: Gfo/Idh/MocA family oxidoreductase [Gemmatimonadales bacterium]|jgi:predicted dehydrogenase|nr:Gfo/Idh/MocA family oxidoreductase [Gemmatimonadales bacterium]